MDNFFTPSTQALLAGLGSWMSIALGAALIYTRKEFSHSFLQIMLGVAGGMMLGATFFALLIPSMELAAQQKLWGASFTFVQPVTGLILGAAFLRIFDALLPHMHGQSAVTEGIQTSWHSSILLVTAMALHHIPEGLAMGVSYGAVNTHVTDIDTAEMATSAALQMEEVLLLTTSMMLQGIPEGTVVSMALLRQGLSRHKAFFFGVLSGCTTPIGALLGLWGTTLAAQILPTALAFAAGAMLYIIVEDIIPEAQASEQASGQISGQNRQEQAQIQGHGHGATLAILGGLILVIIFQTIFS